MFKKLKDKLAEEVKSSPQRIQQFAQAAQAAVTSASSSISDITNNELFSIGGDDTPQNSPARLNTNSLLQGNQLQDSLGRQSPSNMPSARHIDRETTPTPSDGHTEDTRLRRLSNSSMASDVSFRLPTYESSPMYHLQSDMDVSASEAEDWAFSGASAGSPGLERVSKEQLYSAYRRTRDRSAKYRARYTELARHYKLLERDNAKARSVLVETQDKALRRISELREQSALEKSAKAHLENSLRVELDEKNLKIDSLNTKIKLLHSYSGKSIDGINNDTNGEPYSNQNEKPQTEVENLIDLNHVNPDNSKPPVEDSPAPEISVLNNKIAKMEQLLNKYKESQKSTKEKCSKLSTDIQIVANELEKKTKENEQLQAAVKQLAEAREHIQELKEYNQDLQDKLNDFDANEKQEFSQLETELNKAYQNMKVMSSKIEVFTKREEEYAISLAENKLSIHKELESKESEIKLLKEKVLLAANEIHSLEIIKDEFKTNNEKLEAEKLKAKDALEQLQNKNNEIIKLLTEKQEIQKLCQTLEQKMSKLREEYKCLEMQVKQETAEKLAMKDRNDYLETRNNQLTEDNSKKNKQIVDLEKEMKKLSKCLENEVNVTHDKSEAEKSAVIEELEGWKTKYLQLESEIKDEREELIQLQSEIEKLLLNHESLQKENVNLKTAISDLHTQLENERCIAKKKMSETGAQLKSALESLRSDLCHAYDSVRNMKQEVFSSIMEEINLRINNIENKIQENYEQKLTELNMDTKLKKDNSFHELETLHQEIENLKKECAELLNKKDKSELAARTREQECEILKKENILLTNNQIKAEEELLRKHQEIEKNNQECVIIRDDLLNLQEEVKTKENEIQRLKDECHQLNHVKVTSENELKTNKEEIEILKQECGLLKNNKVNSEKSEEEIKQKENSLFADINLLNAEKQELVQKILQIEDENAHLSASNTDLLKKTESLENKNIQIEKQTEEILENLKSLEKELEAVKESHISLDAEKNDLLDKISKMEHEEEENTAELRKQYEGILSENNGLSESVKELDSKFKNVTAQRDSMKKKLADTEAELNIKTEKLMEYEINKDVWQEKLASILEENNVLHEKCEGLKQQKELFHEKVLIFEQKVADYERKISKSEESGVENEFLNLRVSQLENDLDIAKNEYENVQSQNKKLETDLQAANLLLPKSRDEIDALNKKFSDANIESTRLKEKLTQMHEMADQEKEILKRSIKDLKLEIESKSSTIEKLQNSSTLGTQEIESFKQKEKLNNDKYEILQNESISFLEKLKIVEQQYKTATEDYEKEKTEKSRLQSDNAGLQTHLAKVSKDNSQLNDKIREILSNEMSGNVKDKTEEYNSSVLNEIESLKTSLKVSSDKIEDLERQNAILVEEKLELEDQIKSQSISTEQNSNSNILRDNTDKDLELLRLQEKYSDLLEGKTQLESKLADMELLGRSGDGNIRQLEHKNEKLKLSNDKLERRLDEALVSLRHLRALEESTELEYLRNILYEYLTGPGTHSLTLAKVLSAVVKFDDRQTQLVLQREKERQGLLGQLGLL